MVKPPRRTNIIESGDIDKATCLFEELLKKFKHDFVLEERTTPVFNEQAQFESAVQIRTYRLYDNGKPTPHCIKFVYDLRDKDKSIFGVKYNVTCRVESREYIDTKIVEVNAILNKEHHLERC